MKKQFKRDSMQNKTNKIKQDPNLFSNEIKINDYFW